MKLTDEEKAFIHEHKQEEVTKLLLGANRFPHLNVPFLVEQILARRQIHEKLPSWAMNEELIFPAKITAEQCSSEQTAAYKGAMVTDKELLCDLTGGLGIDSFFFSRHAKQVIYVERFPLYCEAAVHNFSVLGADNITVVNADSMQYIDELPAVDLFYLDPARRGEGNKRVFALSDCEPDLTLLLPRLLEKAPRVIAKISPMADIRQTLALLPGTVDIHVLAVRNECKELLFEIGRNAEIEPRIHCENFSATGASQSFDFSLSEEQAAIISCTSSLKKYLYEPNAAILKAGAFKVLAKYYPIEKLHVSSHLYTSDDSLYNFPGRIFEVEECMPFSGKLCKELSKVIPQANITVRNFPLTVDALRKKCKVKDGGEVYLFATTLANNEKVLVRCRKVTTATRE